MINDLIALDGQMNPILAASLRIAVVLLLAWVAVLFSHRLIRTIRKLLTKKIGDAEEAKRLETIGNVLRYLATVVITLVSGMLILGALGISVAPILGAAGVVGLAVGFGAQSLVKDYFSGLFMLLENQMRHGDMVRIAGVGGVVEDLTLRYVQLRDYDGHVHFIPNGCITMVTNLTREYAYAVIDVGVAYRENVDEALGIMRRVGADMRTDEAWQARLLDDIEIAGVENWADSAVTLRARFKVAPMQHWSVRREYLRRLKFAFDDAGIEIPFPHLTVYPGQNKDGSAPALHVAGLAPRP